MTPSKPQSNPQTNALVVRLGRALSTEQRPKLSRHQRRLLKAFKNGVELSCRRPIWARILDWYREKSEDKEDTTQEWIAAQFGLDRSAVSRLEKGVLESNGRLLTSPFFVPLTDLSRPLGELDRVLPNRIRRFSEGYCAAIEKALEQQGKTLSGEAPTCVEFLLIAAIHHVRWAEEHLDQFRDICTPPPISDVLPNAKKLVAWWLTRDSEDETSNEMLTSMDETRVQELLQRWGEVVIPCVKAIPVSWYSWNVEPDGEREQ